MKTEQIIQKIKSIPGGRFFRIRYISKARMTAQALKDGITVFKIVDTTTRTGVQYGNIKSVVYTNPTADVHKRKNAWEWVVKNRIKHNLTTGKDYVVLAPLKQNDYTITTYIMTDKDGNTSIKTKDEIQEYIIKSSKTETPSVITVSLDNVLLVK